MTNTNKKVVKEIIALNDNAFSEKKFLGWKDRTISQRFALVTFFIVLPIPFFISTFIAGAFIIDNNPALLAFGIADQFTYLSNLLSLFIFGLIVFKPYHKWLKGNRLILANASYMLFTFAGYNIVLSDGYANGVNALQTALDNGENAFIQATAVVENVWVHVLHPLLAIALFFITMVFDNRKMNASFLKQTIQTQIFPWIYATYVCIVPFILVSSVSTGQITFDRTQPVIPYSVYGSATDTNTITGWLYVFGFMGGFFAWTVGFHFLGKLIYKKRDKAFLFSKQ